MTRWVTATAVALVLVGHAHRSVAQVTYRPAEGQSAPVTGHIQTVPSPDRSATGLSENQPPVARPPFISTLSHEPRPGRDRQTPIPFAFHVGAGAWPFGLLTLWPSAVVISVPTDAAAAIAVGPTDGASLGGLQLDVQPWRAQVYVDGDYVGLVDDFNGYYHHLELVAGRHVIVIVAPNYQPLILDALVTPGRTATYRGSLTRAPAR